ncbi:hypothetical protein HY251_16255, partial [bacterium]|nr:hypothetical protein [bacterium]
EIEGRAAQVCGLCRLPMASYCTINDSVATCERCAYRVRDSILAVTPEKVLKAIAFGLAAAVATSAAWGAIIQAVTVQSGSPPGWGYVIASLVMGAAIGTAVRKGSGNRGGLGFQVLAGALTLLAWIYAWAPAMYFSVLEKNPDAVPALVAGQIFVQTVPLVLTAIAQHAPLMGLFALFGVAGAWRRNVLAKLEIKGPFPVEPARVSAPPSPAAALPGTEAVPAPPPAAVVRPVLPPPAPEAKGAGIDFERPQA